MLNYQVISSSSTDGNCVLINDVMIDIGVPFKKIKPTLYGVKYLLITHIHTDHLKMATYRQIKKLFPNIKIIGNYEVAQQIEVDYIANEGYPIKVRGYEFTPFLCPHNALCYGFTWEADGQNIIYATDTATLEHAPTGPFDWFFIESNHDEQKLAKVMNQRTNGYSPWDGGKRHLSTQKAKAFFYLHRKSTESKWVELHKSSRFY